MTELKSTKESARVIVGIPTFRRPAALRQLLESVAALENVHPTEVIVAENDERSRQGVQVVDSYNISDFPWKLRCIVVPERGISQARNALMEEAFANTDANFLAMVDDDETVDRYWIQELLAKQSETGADVVGGRVGSTYPDGRPSWTCGISIYDQSVEERKESDCFVQSTANVLLHSRLYRELEQKFDSTYSLTGGGDKEYFVRLKGLGARFAYAPEAITYETYGKSRLTLRWALQRSFRIGAADMRIHMQHSRGFKLWSAELAKVPLAIIVSVVSLPFLVLFNRSKAVAALLLTARQAGKMSSLLGIRYQVYKVIHGQ